MSEFLSGDLDADLIKESPPTWRLNEPVIYQSDVAGQTFTVPAGFVSDLASVPRWPVIYLLAGGTANEASVVHDWLYSTHAVPRAVADAVLREASAVTGVPAWRRWLMWMGVRIGGGGNHWNGPTPA
ncbi:DUF1353 domain-containing protein [Paraburkholderia sp. FT54]|uniref:DUF1353 domain-containing protein n=1 Tax=Paraburkholderia sp. FT54 TaxID=3074437 RepID=UPI0028781550|nr:DUF1353 domain-containing protein [Paraburkholderia sp. FT54]WNC88808.1 DUF1353 domain-containing protein [Paraburkholderia sp. FT54]